MKQQLLHTPEGVRDIYNQQCENKLYLESKFHEVFHRFGYQPIQTPTFEFFDIYSKEIGTTPSKELFKFFDREGNTLVLRPDITPSVARCASKYFMDEQMPIRLYYLGNTFINNSSYQGRLKEVTQAGAEMIGDNTVDADAELIAMSIESLQATGLKEFQISIGHVGFFNGMVEASRLEEDVIEELNELMKNRNFWGVEELIQPLEMEADLKQLFCSLGKFYATGDDLAELLPVVEKYPVIKNAVTRLIELYNVLKLYEVEEFVSFEPGMPEMLHYYTGIIFNGFSHGSGEPIVKGGRYDKLLSHFGKDTSAIGFAIVVDQIMNALSRQKIAIPNKIRRNVIVYSNDRREAAFKEAKQMRKNGSNVELICMAEGADPQSYRDYVISGQFESIIFIDGNE